MRLTIERLRTLILVSGILILAALVALLAIGKWRNPFNRRDIPKRLGIDIQQEANGFTYAQSRGGHTLFRIHASKVIQLKKGKALLHDVWIELYGDDGRSVDRIEGDEFDYDQQAGIARAAGPVEITLTRAGQAMALAQDAHSDHQHEAETTSNKHVGVGHTAVRGEIHVKTSGLTFDQKSGIASTSQHLEFALQQGTGSATGASFDSQKGLLVMEHAVDLHFERGAEPIHVTAEHAEFARGDQLLNLAGAIVQYRGDEAKAQQATVRLRTDGSAEEVTASDGFSLSTANGGTLSAPTGLLQCNAQSRPQKGRLEGGVVFSSEKKGRTVHGTSPAMNLIFAKAGVLQSAHLERGVLIRSEEDSAGTTTRRTWQSPVVDLAFRDAGKGHVELASIHGTGGVTVRGETQRGNETLPSHFAADDVVGSFGAGSALKSLTGVGNASMEQTSKSGARQSTSGDRLEASFAQGATHAKTRHNDQEKVSSQIASATVAGNVTILETPAAKPGTEAPAALKATADRAQYEGAGQWLHLYGSPRVDDGGLQLAADKIDLSQSSGDAFAHGNVKATWLRDSKGSAGGEKGTTGNAVFGGQGPAHAIADEAELQQKDGVATLRGNARLWQQADSIWAPLIVLNRAKQTLDARTTSAQEPVRVVLLSTGSPGSKPASGAESSVIRMHGGALKYSAAERKAWMYGQVAGNVEAQTADTITRAREAELELLPPGNHAGKEGAEAQVDRLIATGDVTVSSRGRQGTGEQLVYLGESGKYILTGTASVPPKIIDPQRGSVSGETLIFNSADDSVSIEGGTRTTTTETVSPRKARKHD